MDKENLFSFPPHDFPYSTVFESEDEDFTGLTRRFTRTTSLHEPLSPFKEKRDLWGSPESTLGWSPFTKHDDEINAWNLLYTAGEVARLKMKMEISNKSLIFSAANNNNTRVVVHGAPQSHYCSDGTEFFRQHQFCRNRGGSEWPPPQLQTQHLRPHCQNQHKPVSVMKPLVLGGATAVKKECAGTGVFLPRRYCDNPAEPQKKQACRPANIEARMMQPCNKISIPIATTPQIQAHFINDSFIPHYGRRNTVIVATHQQRKSNIHRGVMESPVNPEMLLPQEWTY